MPARLEFDVDDPAYAACLSRLRWEDMWPRQFRSGGSEAHLGAFTIACITKPFTPGEDATIAWAVAQDHCHLIGSYRMSDGRDFMLLERAHVLQSRDEAVAEQRQHVALKLEEIGLAMPVMTLSLSQHGTNETPN